MEKHHWNKNLKRHYRNRDISKNTLVLNVPYTHYFSDNSHLRDNMGTIDVLFESNGSSSYMPTIERAWWVDGYKSPLIRVEYVQEVEFRIEK